MQEDDGPVLGMLWLLLRFRYEAWLLLLSLLPGLLLGWLLSPVLPAAVAWPLGFLLAWLSVRWGLRLAWRGAYALLELAGRSGADGPKGHS